MNRPLLRVLIVEDCVADAQLMLDALRQEGFDLNWERVESEAAYLAGLHPNLDVILSDNSLPGFSAPRALKLLQDHRLDVPFIIVSGTINEEIAVSAMKQGAADYLLKDRLARLGAAVAHAVKESRARRERQEATERDFTARQHALETVRESERRFRDMLENVGLIAMTLDKSGTITFCNDHLLRVTGWKREEAIGQSWFTQFIPDFPEVRKLFLATIETGTIPKHYENPIRTRSGELREIAWNNTMLRGSAGNFIGTASIGEDVTEKRRAEKALRESEERFRSFMEHSPMAGWIVDAEGRFHYLSPGYYRLFDVGTSDLTGRFISEIYEPDIAEGYLANNEIALREHRVVETVETGARPDGTTGQFMVVKFPMTGPDGMPLLGGIALDVTDRKKLEEQFLRAQRMESIGTMAGGIAHDLNNSLGPIIMSLDLLKMQFPDSASQELLSIISTSAQRGADMVRQVLSFGRGLEGRRSEVQLSHLVREIGKIVNDTFLKNIEVKTSVAVDLWTVMGDSTQLHQVLLNLCLNARDAMPTGGRLMISACNTIVDEQYAGLNLGAKPGPHVLLQVQDNGTGMPPDVLGKIFDPFFTTKEVGKGTGLGLSTTLGIVKSHGGFIRVDSDKGKGTIFQIHLPAQTGAAHDAPGPVESAVMPRGHGELILVVDDEASVREITRQTLEAFGYRVVLATEGADAISKYLAQSKEIDAILLDMTMPVMDGLTAIHVLQRINPNVRIIVTSGRASKSQLAKVAGIEGKHILAKPYTAGELLSELQGILSARL